MPNQKTNKKIIIFLHIPKTAGTTLNGVINAQYSAQNILHEHQHYILFSAEESPVHPKKIVKLQSTQLDNIPIIRGHLLHGYHQFLKNYSYEYFTFLRDPISRTISDYYHITNTPQHYLHKTVTSRQMSLEEYVQSGLWLSDNLQVRFLSGNHQSIPFEQVSESDFLLAKENLKSFAVFGLTERFDESLILLKEVFGWNMLSCAYVRKRVIGSKKASKKKLSPQSRELILKYNYWDDKLYKYANSRFEQQIDSILSSRGRKRRSFNRQLKILSILSRLKIWYYNFRVSLTK